MSDVSTRDELPLAPSVARATVVPSVKPSLADVLGELADIAFQSGKLLELAGPLLELRGYIGAVVGGTSPSKLLLSLPLDAADAADDAVAISKIVVTYMTLNADPTYGPRLRAIVAKMN